MSRVLRNHASPPNDGGGENADAYSQAAETTVVTVPAGTEWKRDVSATAPVSAFNAAITAIRINSSSVGTEPTVLPHHIVPGLRKTRPVGGPPKS